MPAKKKAELIEEAEEKGVDLPEDATVPEIKEALADAEGDAPERDEADGDASPEVARGPLEGTPHDPDATEYAAREPIVDPDGTPEEDAELAHSPEVARGPLGATPAESVRHDNPA